MTVQKDVTKNIYVGNGSTRTFPFTFECPAEHPEYIKVYLMQDDGTALATSDYQLDMDARQITYPSSGTALPEGKKLVIMRELPLQQMMNLVNNGPYFAEDVETAFDENVMAMQQIAEKLNRSIIMSVDIDGDAFVNEVPFEAGKSFRIADDGKSIVLTEDPARVLPLAQEAYAQAQAQAQSASASASAAAKSEDSAAASASEAGNSAQSASTSAAGAAESARLAEGYKNVAETAKSDASLYADNAKTSADNATASKKVAQSAANSASNFATDARSSVSEAKSYRDAASTYATNAKNYSENVNVFVPSVSSDGILSWTNKAGLPNPPSVNIKGKDGADGGVTVDDTLSDTSTNAIQNKVVKAALDNRAVLDESNTFTSPNSFDDIYMADGMSSLKWYNGSHNFVVASINSKKYTGEADTAKKATQDGDGNVITSTYATKTELNSCVKSVNNVTPDENGNVSISIGGGGGGANITVDAELSTTSTNPVQNKVIKGALDDKANLNKLNTFSKENWFQKGMSLLAYKDSDSAIKWYQNPVEPPIASIDATNYTGTAAKATQDGAGNIITETYAKKADVSGVVKSVNGTKPDSNGNVTITVSSGSDVTVDTTLSATSTNAIANKAVYEALSKKVDATSGTAQYAYMDSRGYVIHERYAAKVDVEAALSNKLDTTGTAEAARKDGEGNTISLIYAKKSDVETELNNKLNKTDNAVSATTATRALQDGNGDTIASTYIKSVNNVTPDATGNVTIDVSGGGGGSSVTVDTELSGTSNNAIANKAVYNALLNKVGTDIFTGFALMGATSTIAWRQGSQAIGSINASNYTGTAAMAISDGDGHTITSTYAKKTDISGVVKSVNGTKPDATGNVTITVSGGGVSTDTQNEWTAQQTFDTALLEREKYVTAYDSGTSITPIQATAYYTATGNFTLDLTTATYLLSIGQSQILTVYIKSSADYALTLKGAGTIKYIGAASDLAITSAGLLLNILMMSDGSGSITSIVQASKLS
ncbi:hypothetical protein [Phascolarctobacterium succinatutens]|uniref:hypothetical protein n=1 Tax=Phascolarctobacterium succinatutens TaxID=626940 RepID=UPI004029F2AF